MDPWDTPKRTSLGDDWYQFPLTDTTWDLCERTALIRFDVLGPVQTSCFCRAELNSGIKFDKSTAEARRLNQTFELSSASN